MNPVLVENIKIYFPYDQPYPQQNIYMQHVIKALNDNQHALLESPTGTGKTLSLLCAALGWLNNYREVMRSQNLPVKSIKIVYTSRTHSQLDQVKKELLNTPYSPRCVTLASREHLCVNDMK